MPGGLLTELRRRRDERPDAAALRTATSTGGHLATWAQLHDTARAVAAGAAALPRGAPVLVIVDNTPDSVAALIGLTGAGVDVLPVEQGSSALTDLLAPARNPGCGPSSARPAPPAPRRRESTSSATSVAASIPSGPPEPPRTGPARCSN